MFNFYLDDVLVSDPLDWDKFSEVIERDDTTKALILKYSTRLTFADDGYDVILAKKLSSGLCSYINIRIDYSCDNGGTFENLVTGIMYIADITFRLGKCLAECSVEDDNFTSLIFNNKNLKVRIMYGEPTFPSKNGVAIAGAKKIQTVLVYNPADGSLPFIDTFPFAVTVYDTFDYLVRFLTDDRVGFASDYLDYHLPVTTQLEKVRYLTYFNGFNLRFFDESTGNVPPITSFQELFDEVNKLYPIGIIVERNADGKPILRIESEEYFKNASAILSFPNIPEIEESIDNSLLYSSVDIESQVAEYDTGIHSFPPTPQRNWGPESYYLAGQCNVDHTLKLNSGFILDSNIMQELMFTNRTNTTYDDTGFFMEAEYIHDSPLAFEAWAFSNPSPPGKHYNENLLNVHVLERRVWGTDLYYQPLSGTPVVIVDGDGGGYYASKYSFDLNIPYQDYKSFKESLSSSLMIGVNDPNKKVWIRRSQRVIATSQTSWETVSNVSS